MPGRSLCLSACGPIRTSRACTATRPYHPQLAIQHQRHVISKSSHNDNGGDVQTAETEQSREELQSLVQQLRSEVGSLRTEVAMLKAGKAGVSKTHKPPKPSKHEGAAGGSSVVSVEGEKLSSKQLSSAIKWPSPGSKFWNTPPRDPVIELVDISPPGQANVQRDDHPLDIVHITAEMAPVAKVGGLGDVVQGLAKATADRGNNVQVMLPFYTSIPQESMVGLECVVEFDCPKGEEWDGEMRATSLRAAVHRATIDGISVLLIAPADRNACNIFKGDRIYGGSYNELEAYLFFCRASLEALKVMGTCPDILHLHEWQCAAVSMLYWDVYYNSGFNSARVVLTIHNMDNSGECRQDEFAVTGVPGEMYADINKALDERTIGHNPERLNLLKGGMVYSNQITTVSPTYAEEARSGGAAGFLRTVLGEPHIGAKFSGVLNGIDTSFWCPSTDPLIPSPFNAQFPKGKELCKKFLQTGLGLNVDAKAPLAVCITRLVPQKGIHLIRHSVQHMAGEGAQFVLLGSGHADGDFRDMADNDYKDSKDVRLMVMYSEPLAHMMYAAADFVLVPSLFEPCGLTQMIAMRYGALPIVRRTGGLADTIIDADENNEQGNGFVFDGADEDSCSSAIDRAMHLFRNEPERFSTISRKNMNSDMSWRQSADSYQQLYRSAAVP